MHRTPARVKGPLVELTSLFHRAEPRVVACLKGQMPNALRITTRSLGRNFGCLRASNPEWHTTKINRCSLMHLPSYHSHRARHARSCLVHEPHQAPHRFLQFCSQQRPPRVYYKVYQVAGTVNRRWRTLYMYQTLAVIICSLRPENKSGGRVGAWKLAIR